MMLSSDNSRSLVIWKTLFSPKTPTEDEWLYTCILHTTCTVEDHKCHFDCGWSCENMVLQDVVSRFQILTEKDTNPYMLFLFKHGNEIPITRRLWFLFSIGGCYVCCTLLDRPWHYDCRIIHNGCKKVPSRSIKIIKKMFWVLIKKMFWVLPMRNAYQENVEDAYH